MSDQRRLKSIGARYDVEVIRHPDPWRVLRSRLSWVFAIGTIVACLPWLLGDHRAFQSECVSEAHRVFGQRCDTCHDRPFTPLSRAVTLKNGIHSTSDAKCQKCHREVNSDHLAPEISGESRIHDLMNALTSKFDEIGCAGCHQEHRGSAELGKMADQNCTNCHGSLGSGVTRTRFDLQFNDFRHHPEFAIWKKSVDAVPSEPEHNDLSNSRPNDEQNSQLRTGKRSRSPQVEMENGIAKDRSSIKFNHQRHLDPHLLSEKGHFVELQCADCHQTDSGGAFFRPIDFEQHCHRCHKLGLKETGELPHLKPELIRKVLIDGLAKGIRPLLVRPEDNLGGPTKGPIESAKSATELVSLVKEQLKGMEIRLFGTPIAMDNPQKNEQTTGLLVSSCTKCHVTERLLDAEVPWKVLSPNIPERWMPHSRFRHDRHLSVECSLCHSPDGRPSAQTDRNLFYPVIPEPADRTQNHEKRRAPSSIFESASASDILMPRIEVCRDCHGHASSTSASVSDRCIDCHVYHHVPESKPFPPGILELLNQNGDRRTTNELKIPSVELNP